MVAELLTWGGAVGPPCTQEGSSSARDKLGEPHKYKGPGGQEGRRDPKQSSLSA